MYRLLRAYALAGVALVALAPTPAAAESLFGAFISAYLNNAELNAERAGLRATDEGVPQALAGYRPSVSAGAGATLSRSLDTHSPATFGFSLSLSLEQPIFDGYRTPNGVKAAEVAVLAAREALRNAEANTLLDTANDYEDVVRDEAVLGLSTQNVEFLRQEVRAARERLNVGEGTQSDVEQANARLAAAESAAAGAVATLNASRASYEMTVGHAPRNLNASAPIDRLLPGSVDGAVAQGVSEHPAIRTALHNVDVALLNVKIAEGALLPSVSVSAGLTQTIGVAPTRSVGHSASISGRLSIPLYSGGRSDSQVRAAKERLGQREIGVDVARAQIRAAVISAFGQVQATRAQVTAAAAQVTAAQLALEGIIEERNVGQRTTLEVLNAQQDALNARVGLVRAQHDRVVASYTLLAAIGKLSAASLGLDVPLYQPEEHMLAVRDLWGGLRTPDGR